MQLNKWLFFLVKFAFLSVYFLRQTLNQKILYILVMFAFLPSSCIQDVP